MQIQLDKLRPILSQEVLRIRDRPIVQVHHTPLDRVLHQPEILPAIAGLQATQAHLTVHHPEVLLQVLHLEEAVQVVVRPAAAHQAEVQVEVAQAVLATEDSAEPKK